MALFRNFIQRRREGRAKQRRQETAAGGALPPVAADDDDQCCSLTSVYWYVTGGHLVVAAPIFGMRGGAILWGYVTPDPRSAPRLPPMVAVRWTEARLQRVYIGAPLRFD